MRAPTFTLILLTAFVSIILFVVKYRVQTLNDQLVSMDSEIVADREAIHILKAEWSHLNDPDRLRDLAIRHLDLHRIDPSRIIAFEQIDESLPVKHLTPKSELKTKVKTGANQ